MIMNSFGHYLAKTVHDHETALGEGVRLGSWHRALSSRMRRFSVGKRPRDVVARPVSGPRRSRAARMVAVPAMAIAGPAPKAAARPPATGGNRPCPVIIPVEFRPNA